MGKKDAKITFSVKEMFSSINEKLDIIEENINLKLDDVAKELGAGNIKFTGIQTSLSWHKRLIWSMFGALGGLLILTLKLTKVI